MFRARALVDPGSEVNLATEGLADHTGCARHKITVPLADVSGDIFETAESSATFQIFSRYGGPPALTVTVLILKHLGIITPRMPASGEQWPHLKGINLADPTFTTPGDIDFLLGAEAYSRIIHNGLRRGPYGTPTAQRSALGWLVFGGAGSIIEGTVCAVSSPPEAPLAELLKRFWSLEEVNGGRHMSAAEEDCERQFVEGFRRDATGRYTVRLPMKQINSFPACGTLNAAKRALKTVQARMRLDPEYAEEYCRLSDYESLGHMRLVPDGALPPEASRVSYLPHHAIWQVSDQNKILRLVFNASCRVGQGPSLNECLHTGPPLQSDLISIICRWRLLRIAAGADIEKMYRQILVDLSHVDLQRILWQGQDGSVSHYQLLTVTYGVNCAPYLALRVLKQLAHDEAKSFPRAARIITDSSYVDDILYGADDVATARQLRDELIGLTEAGGFRLRKWSSSHPHVLDDLPETVCLRPEWRDFSAEQPVKTLGVAWDPSKDEIRYRSPQSVSPAATTKRTVLSVIARFFDPLGWVSPIIIVAKILLQDM